MTRRRFVLLDRDGTVIVEKHYLADPKGVELIEGAAEGLRRLRELGLGLVVLVFFLTTLVLVVVSVVVLMSVTVPVLIIVVVMMAVFVAARFLFLVPSLLRHSHARMDGVDAVLVHRCHREVEADAKAFELLGQLHVLDAEIEQETEEHVACYACEGIEIEYPAGCSFHACLLCRLSRRSRAAARGRLIVVDSYGRVHTSRPPDKIDAAPVGGLGKAAQ